jgi:CheY-like chemotaxis protein
MGQANPFKPMALVVEDDVLEREMVAALLEESEMGVIQCASAEEALRVLEKIGRHVSMIVTTLA